jgi:transcriptional regulator with XRE-family HTH domain
VTITGKQIRAARVGLGLTIKALAAAVRISPTTLNKIENGSNAQARTLARLRGELESRGASFKFEAGLAWLGIPADHGHTVSDAARSEPATATTDKDALINRLARAVLNVQGWHVENSFDAIQGAREKLGARGEYLARIVPAIRQALTEE